MVEPSPRLDDFSHLLKAMLTWVVMATSLPAASQQTLSHAPCHANIIKKHLNVISQAPIRGFIPSLKHPTLLTLTNITSTDAVLIRQ